MFKWNWCKTDFIGKVYKLIVENNPVNNHELHLFSIEFYIYLKSTYNVCLLWVISGNWENKINVICIKRKEILPHPLQHDHFFPSHFYLMPDANVQLCILFNLCQQRKFYSLFITLNDTRICWYYKISVDCAFNVTLDLPSSWYIKKSIINAAIIPRINGCALTVNEIIPRLKIYRSYGNKVFASY